MHHSKNHNGLKTKERESLMYLDDNASPELARTMLQHSFKYAHL
jgi:hypothetical protein